MYFMSSSCYNEQSRGRVKGGPESTVCHHNHHIPSVIKTHRRPMPSCNLRVSSYRFKNRLSSQVLKGIASYTLCFLFFSFLRDNSLYLRSKRIAVQEIPIQAETQMVFVTLFALESYCHFTLRPTLIWGAVYADGPVIALGRKVQVLQMHTVLPPTSFFFCHLVDHSPVLQRGPGKGGSEIQGSPSFSQTNRTEFVFCGIV